MRKILIGAAAILMMGGTAQAQNFDGLWMTENGKAVVALAPCDGNSICGEIHWLRADAKQYDYKNSNAELRQTPLCGLKILWGFRPDGAQAWKDGTIYKADDGDVYHAQMELRPDGTLHLRGYVGIPMLGKSQTWHRVDPAQYPRCEGPAGPYDPADAAPARASGGAAERLGRAGRRPLRPPCACGG